MRRRLVPFVLLVTVAACGDGGGQSAGSPSPSVAASATTAAPSSLPTLSASPTTTRRPALQGTPRLAQVAVLGGLSPMLVGAPPGDRRLFVAERAGRIRIIDGTTVRPQPFLDIRDQVATDGERGLLHFAFAPDYTQSGRVYVLYTAAGTGSVTLARFTRGSDPDKLDAASRETVLAVGHPRDTHNGGTIAFDRTGMLLWSLGDGGGANDPKDNAQNLGTHLGKILRLDVSKEENGRKYAIPPDNPYRDVSGALAEIYAVGLRNPWRFTLDDDGTLYLGDVGQNAVEEVDVVAPDQLAGANFGWPAFEGRRRTSKPDLVPGAKVIEPTLVYAHGDGGCAVTGGYVYRGRVAALQGKYLYGDVCKGQVLAVTPGQRDATPTATGLAVEQLVSFGRDGAGEIYVVSLAGYVRRITAG
jgi:glucose/arabinose dehydrogenase